MIKIALTCIDINLVKQNRLKHSIDYNSKHFAKNTISQSMAKSGIKVNVCSTTLQSPLVSPLKMDVERNKSPEQLTFVPQTKTRRRRSRRRKKKPVAVQNGGALVQETDELASNKLMSMVLTTSTHNDRTDVDAGISRGLFPRLPFVRPRKKLLILDINGLLADIVSPPPKEYRADTKIARRAVFRRPACREFLNFCFKRFEVGVWSSRSEKIASRVLDYLMGDMKQKLLFCWDLSRCTATGFRTLENRHKTLVFKELRRVWEKHDPDLPWQKGEYNESNTLLLDDSPYKALLNPDYTAVFPQPYKFGDNGSDSSLGIGGDLRVYLEELSAAKDVRKFVEQNPFGQRPISKSSSTWDFYFKVITTMYSLPASI